MLVVGLTGNVASGKSVVGARLASLGAMLVDADQLAREAVAPGAPGLAAIVARWGTGVLQADGSLDRTALRRIALADPAERRALEAIVHPAVEILRSRLIADARTRGILLLVCDIPLLFEARLEGTVDRIVVVDAPAEVRRARLIRDRDLDPAEADALIATQTPSSVYRARAQHVIENSGTLESLRDHATALYHELDRIARSA